MIGVSVFMWVLSVVAGFFRHLALEVVEPLLDERKKCVPIHLQVMRRDDGLVNFLGQNVMTRSLRERRIGFLEKTALPRNGLDNPLALQLGVSLGDRVAVHA